MEHLGPLCAIYVSSNLDFKAATDPELDGTFGTVICFVDSSSVHIFLALFLVPFVTLYYSTKGLALPPRWSGEGQGAACASTAGARLAHMAAGKTKRRF